MRLKKTKINIKRKHKERTERRSHTYTVKQEGREARKKYDTGTEAPFIQC